MSEPPRVFFSVNKAQARPIQAPVLNPPPPPSQEKILNFRWVLREPRR